jgi:hypothetical protein
MEQWTQLACAVALLVLGDEFSQLKDWVRETVRIGLILQILFSFKHHVADDQIVNR